MTRKMPLAIAVLMIVIAIGGYATYAVFHSGLVEETNNTRITLAFTGDVMLGRLVNEVINEEGEEYPWGDTLPLLRNADLSLVNLECVIAEEGEEWNRTPKAFFFRADPEAIMVLNIAGIDYVSLANNHILDFQKEGLIETLDHLNKAGVKNSGAGRNLEEASKPALLESKGIRVGVLSFTDNEPLWAATADKPGTNYTPISLEEKYFRRVRESIESLREEVDIVVFSMHWGPNIIRVPTINFIRFAHAVVDAGADIFHGYSSHYFQGIEVYREKLIMYGCGDFIDDYAVDLRERNDWSFLFLVNVTSAGIEDVELVPVVISGMQVNKARGYVFEIIAGKMRNLSLDLGTRVEGGGGRLIIKISEKGKR
jgi:poly-gamma-glutamate capsule biosynthesis protein CapA/YwtB (metallophosphatase superfamily)